MGYLMDSLHNQWSKWNWTWKKGALSDSSPRLDLFLCLRARTGNLKAYDHLVFRHKELVFNFNIFMLGNEALGEILTERVFLEAYHQLPSLSFIEKYSNWILRKSVHASREVLQDWKITLNWQTQKGSSSKEKPLGPKIDGNLSKPFFKYLQFIFLLPVELKEVLILREINRIKEEDIAQVLDLSVGMVQSRLHRARMKLKDQLREQKLLPSF